MVDHFNVTVDVLRRHEDLRRYDPAREHLAALAAASIPWRLRLTARLRRKRTSSPQRAASVLARTP